MGSNFHTPYAITTKSRASELNTPLAALDKQLSYQQNMIIHCDGDITYDPATGVLAWSGALRILFNTAAGLAVQNTVATGNVTLADNEFAYVTLNETNDTALSVSKTTITTGTTSNFLAQGRLVLGYRNTASDGYFPVALHLTATGLEEIVEDTTPQLGGDLDLNQKSISLATALGTDHTAVGMIDAVTVDVNATGFGAALYIASDGNYEEADADASTTMPCTALAIDTGTGASKKVLLWGYMRDDTWDWTPGGLLYISATTGALTQTAPSSTGQQVQVVGVAKTADIIFFNPSLVLVEV